MKRIKEYLVSLSIIALLLFPIPISGQRTTLPPQSSTQAKFRKGSKAIPNKYIVVLNDDVVSRTARVAVRQAQVSTIADSFAQVTTKFELQNFVTVQYIGHLRREPEDCHGSPDPANCGYIFHYNRFPLGGDPNPTENLITRGFIESPEYRQRFGP